ncbi:MAG: elongation factor P, partial [Ignavibacteriales bacterium]|nr:elongation factor P [Ignavibacteriales bacterium]
IVEFQHVNPGNWRAFVRAKLKNIKSGKVVEIRFRAGEAIDQVRVENREFQFLYADGQGFNFMNQETYDQMSVDKDLVGDGAQFLKEGAVVKMLMDGFNVLSVDIPLSVVLKVVETEPGVKGDTATGAQKRAKVETGAMVNVPLFINEGDSLKIDTRTGDYLERVKN